MSEDIFMKAEIPAEFFGDRKHALKDSNCTVELVTANKVIVETLLRGNIGNRKINKSNLSKLANEFSNGRFRFTGQPIIRDKDGVLRDGQHRLLALRAANYPSVPILIVTLLADKSEVEKVYDVMDTGVTRKFGQLLQHKGCDDALKVAALCKKIPYIETGYSNFPVKPDSYYLDVLKLYRTEIEAVAPLCKHRGFRADMGAAACVVAKVTGCLDEIVSIVRRAIDADMLKIGTPEHTLNKIINDNLRAIKKGQGENAFYFAVTANCFIAALNNEKYPLVNRNIKKALSWIEEMANDNKVMLLPKPIHSV